MDDPYKWPAEPSRAAIREASQRVLSQSPFNRSPVLSRFLRHVVSHAINSEAPPLKEYAIGLEVFEKAEDFDPRLDSIVRVQARRLRAALEKYYRNEGRHDSVRIALPKGHYGIQAYFADSRSIESTSKKNSTQLPRQKRRSSSLPSARTQLIGRESELAQLKQVLIKKPTRLLSVTGVGGMGKTRIALAVAEEVKSSFPGGVMFLDLASITDPQVLLGALADIFEVRRTDGLGLEQVLFKHIHETLSEPLLLVLDNLEGIIKGVDILAELLDSSAQITLLITSRIPLHLYGEFEFPLAPLAVPDGDSLSDLNQIAKIPSVALFLARATAANPGNVPSSNLQALAELCIRLEGIPLAIELVAAQAASMTPEEMLERFRGHLDLPQNPAHDAPSRQLTMRRVLDSSYELLDLPASMALRRLSIFSGGFHLDAVEAVVDAQGDIGSDLLSVINNLVAMGLVFCRIETHQSRFWMLDILRKYGWERLNANQETDRVRKAHAAYYVVLAEEGIGELGQDEREAWLTRCDDEHENFRQAIYYLVANGPHRWALRLGHALFLFWERREKFPQARQLLDVIINDTPIETDPGLWAKVASYAATMAAFQGDTKQSEKLLNRALEVHRRIGNRRGEVSALNALAINALKSGDNSTAYDLFLQCLNVCRQIGEPVSIAEALSNLADCSLKMNNVSGVLELLEEAHELFIQEKDASSANWCVSLMGDLAFLEGNFDRAAMHYKRAESEFARMGDVWGLSRSLSDRGRLAIELDNYEEAQSLLLDAMAGFASLKHQRGMAKVAERMAKLALAVGQPKVVIRLLAAAKSWRKAVGCTPISDDLKLATQLSEQAKDGFSSSLINTLQHEGSLMSVADVSECFSNLLTTRQT